MSKEVETPALSRLNKGLRGIGSLLAGLALQVQQAQALDGELRAEGVKAWNEREKLLSDYYDAVRSALTLLEACDAAREAVPELGEACRELDRTLRAQGVSVVEPKKGEPFDARLHDCQEAIKARRGARAGVVVQVTRLGYVQERADGTVAVIRPAKVIATKDEAATGGG